MITGPAAALSALARFQPLDLGDLLLTGTPGGTALQAPPAVIEKWGTCCRRRSSGGCSSPPGTQPAYLKAGDVVTASIATEDDARPRGPAHRRPRRTLKIRDFPIRSVGGVVTPRSRSLGVAGFRWSETEGPTDGSNHDRPGPTRAGDAGRRGRRQPSRPASDGVELHRLRWYSGRSPPWAVVIFHGIASHGGWFAETAADLATAGVAVYAPDRRGSGRSGGPRGHLDRYERALDDVDEMVRLVSAEHPGTPLFLAASSWAAKLGVVYVARPRRCPGCCCSAPGCCPRSALADAPARGRRRPPRRSDGPPAHPADAGAVHHQSALPRRHPSRPAAPAEGDHALLLGDRTAGPRPTARRRRPGAPAPPSPRRGRRDDGRGRHAPLVLPARRRGQDLPGLSGRRPHLDFEPDRSRYLADMLGWLSARVPSGSSRSGAVPRCRR